MSEPGILRAISGLARRHRQETSRTQADPCPGFGTWRGSSEQAGGGYHGRDASALTSSLVDTMYIMFNHKC